jgi:glycosyltransferase involved in cell wall biosynthesis
MTSPLPAPDARKVIFDGMFWGGQERGVATSTRRLFQAVSSARPAGYEIRALVSDASGLADEAPGSVHRVGADRIMGLQRALWQQVVLPLLLRRHQADLLIATCYTAPVVCGVPYVLIVHDLIAWLRPDLCPLGSYVHARLLLRASARRARLVVVPSDAVGAALVERLGIERRRIRTLPWGVDREIRPVRRDAAALLVRQRFGLEGPFVLFVGCVERKKGVALLARACQRLGLTLVTAGPGSPPGAGQALGTARVARHLGFVSAEMLGALYSSATAVVLPSIVEGFGLPAVEAMHCGAPVVASDIPALREVCAGAAVHFEQGNQTALEERLAQLMRDETLRARLSAQGRARAGKLTWSEAAKRFVAMLDEVAT